ncbi:MAG: DUF4215 domain-containing protein, partial [Candidatus Magasanikbacteria bacterium]|nr:DUF4215 domain-containing protein [Candidatus Magasanikbacteria bacterium]
TQNAEVADITHFETVGNLSEYCTAGCTSIGSNIPRSTENPRICGNGVVDLGEDCDIQDIVRFKDGNPRLINDTPVGEVVGESCSLNCLRPGSAAPFCGNGIIEPEQGEECDPEDPNDPSEGRFCDPIRCLNIGTSSREPEGDVGQSWCGSGFVTAGEDCDIADGRIGCSPICLHTGTPLAVSWCDEFGQDLEVCNNAVSVCGNQVVESGEQCEIIREVQPGLFLMAFPNGEQGISVTRGSECNDGCLLENICEGPSIPSSLRCTAGEPGCNDDCTYAGSSIGYENPSVCGDGIQGVGEYVGCEDPNQQGNNRLEEHPIQIVTAIGQGNPEEFPTIQFTEISVEANSIERPPTEDRPLITVDDITPPVEGTGDYFLQCGYEEFDEQVNGQFNNCPNAEDGVASNSCCYPRPRRSASYPRDLAGIGNEEGVCRNTFISVSFDEVIDEETLNGNVWIAKGYEDAVNCRDISDGREVDVTGELQETLVGVLLEDTPPETLFAKVWWHAKKAFYTIVGRKAQASQINNNALNIETWCSGEIAPQPHVIYDQEGDSVTTTVELYLEDLLEADTTYAIILRGGLEGITDVNDVGIGNPDNTNLLHDSVIFRTTEEVCKLADLDVDPPQHLFSVPETGQEFVVESRSSNGQRIVPIEDVYNWTWDWGPKNHNIFEIPFAPATTTEAFTLIGSRTVEGQGIGVASATVIQDRTPDSHEGRVFTGVTQLTSLFCERPWPVHNVFPYEDGNPPGRELNDDEYAPNEFDILPDEGFRGGEAPSVFGKFYNFSLNYCADAGRQGVSDDDLPYLRPFVFTPEFSDTVKQCAHGDNVGEACSADGDCFNRVCSENDALSCTDDSSCAVTEDFGPCLVDQNFCELADIFCTEDIECIDFQSYGQCGAGENTLNACQSVRSLPNEVQKRWLMFNEVNNDVVGVQIFDNPGRLSAARWYQDQGIRDITFQNISDFVVIAVDGFDAITDGDNFYINALNKVNQGVVENYILHISVNENAREDTREVVEKLIDSLQFNINVSDYGFCLAEGTEIIDSALEFISENSLANITTDTCVTDFDCRDAGGSPLPQTIGVCSNARTKFLRDWERLQDVAPVQNAFEQFKRNEGTYPQLESGTFIPRYTNSRWPSWGLLGQSIGGAPSDQINEWSACGVCSDRVNDQATFCVSNADCPGSGNACELKDARTCWDVASSQYMCPLAASVYEYEAIDEENYSLHVPLEYFGNQNTVVEEFVPDQESFTTERWCQPGQIISPFGEACGDGIVNQVSEQCDPPGSRILSSQGYYPTEEGLCNYDNTQTSCSTDADCPISLLEEGVNFADVPETEVCLVDNEIIFTERNENEIDGVFQCNSTDACRDIRTYSEEGLPTAVSVLSNPIRQETIDATLLENPFQRTRFTCGAIKDSESYLGLNLETTQCVGAQEGEVGLCREGDVGVGICNNECQYVYGSCREIFECGNGVVEGDEACDDGSVNGEYGQCNSQCTGFSGVARCGDGQINIDQDTNQPLEHCEIIEDTHVTLNSGANKIRVIYPQLLEESSGSDIIIRMCNNEGIILCERAFIEFGSLFQNIEDIKDEESYQTHYCSGDPQLRCDIERGNADCTAPSPDNVIDLLDNEITRNDVREKVLPVDELVSYGDCVEAGTNRYGSSYHHFEGVSCSEDCQRAGGYCGDGIIESVESCDDGNNVDGDGCSAICQIEEGENNNQNNNQQEVRCDDGIVQAERGEVCDLGVENGIACVPGYDESCTYCSDDCREVLQVDSPLFCGNNDIEDIEVCEFIDNTVTYRKQYCQFEDEVLDTLCTQNSECHGTCFALGGICVLGDRVWAAGCNTDQECTQEELFCGVELSEEVFTEGCADVGEYSCNNSCTNVTNDCLSCNLVSPPGGTVPRAKFINPLFGHQEFDEEDNWSGRATVRLFREQGGFFNPLNQRIWQGSHITIGSDYEVTLLGSEEARIETNVRCSGEYEVEFNRSRVSLGEYNEFLYPVRGQAEAITNEFIASPAVPEGTFRVVLRWTNDEGGENAPFLLNVYNQEFNDRVFGGFPKVLGYPIDTSNPFVSEISGSLGLSENPNYSNYWWPTDNMHQWYEHVYAHREQSLDNTFIQSFTIETDKPQGEGSVENATYAIFVGTDGVPIFGHIHSNLQVEVYEYNERQNPRYSIYKPAHTFEIRGAAGTSSNEVARYWHAFNLVKKNGGYEVEVVKEGNREYEDGTIESGFQDVKCNISTEFCNDSENENEQNQEG